MLPSTSPRTWQNNRVVAVSVLYNPRLDLETLTGFSLLSDSAFPRSVKALEGKIIRSREMNKFENEWSVLRYISLSAVEELIYFVITSERQAE